MISQERGIEGISIYFIFLNHPFLSNGGSVLRKLLGEKPRGS
jgi:hypothetical protein